MASYLRVRTNGVNDPTGYLIYFSSVDSIDEQLGVQTFDLSLPQSTSRLLTPTTGKQDDLSVQVKFIDDGTNKCISIDNVGNQTNLNLTTTEEQFNFIRDNIISNKVVSIYEMYLDWLGDGSSLTEGVYRGWATINNKVLSDSNFSFFIGNITFKVGGNPFSV